MTYDEFNLSGRVAIVTGGSDGIGAATAQLLSRRGADVVIASRTADNLERRAATIREATGGRCLAVPTDVQEEAQIKHLVQRTLDEFGRIDILVNNAGGSLGVAQPLISLTPSRWQTMLNLNLMSAVICSQEVVPHFIERRSGVIVNVSSFAGVQGVKGFSDYSAAKAGVQMYTRVAAAEWGAYGIRVNCVAPGMIATDTLIANLGKDVVAHVAGATIPLGRPGRPDELAQVIVFMASDAASFVTGETLLVAGGPPKNKLDD